MIERSATHGGTIQKYQRHSVVPLFAISSIMFADRTVGTAVMSTKPIEYPGVDFVGCSSRGPGTGTAHPAYRVYGCTAGCAVHRTGSRSRWIGPPVAVSG